MESLRNWHQVKQTLYILRDYKDFELERAGRKYLLRYNNHFGYEPDNLEATFFFDYDTWVWVVDVNGEIVLTRVCPLWELIMELRGYLLAYQPSLGDIVVDAGASTGFITSVFAKLVGDRGKVICLEPDPVGNQILRETLALNRLQNCVVIDAALSDRDGSVLLLPEGGASHVVENGDVDLQRTEKNIIEVRATTFRSLLSQIPDLQVGNIKMIKLDIEGAELDVLDELLHLLSDNRELVINIASYHLFQGEQTYKCIERRCHGYDYAAVKTIYPIHTTTVLTNINNKEVIQRLAKLRSYDESVLFS